MRPRVTAILVARNGGEYLERTLKSLALQSQRPDSFIFVDAGSTDDTAARLAQSAPAQFVQADGVRSLRQSGLLKVMQGLTSLEEVLAVTNE